MKINIYLNVNQNGLKTDDIKKVIAVNCETWENFKEQIKFKNHKILNYYTGRSVGDFYKNKNTFSRRTIELKKGDFQK